ncbi:hypothetical protein GCM10008955_01070 [Deinococcus malanensis]|uniref:Anaphase-promoting complex subunit 4-like WD40 domain-containing protein n=1 Tax=Deinococcus malanensis TaxID=1706855 RepID=A0ABQ2EHK3_9DEIO|nr:PQQ-binding-like beta-propeller repeat protein [Deinococcus malanensis]GGK11628.1 hypothetical protein GCM10008955_01070 [Deinococcus malanensis]
MAPRRPLSKKSLAFLCVFGAFLGWSNYSAVLTRILHPGERYPASNSLLGKQKYEGFDAASASRDGLALAAGSQISQRGKSFTATVSVIDRPSGKRRWQTKLNTPPHFRSVNVLLWTPDDQQVVANDTDGYVTVLDARSGQILKQLQVHTYRPCVFGFANGGLLLTEKDIQTGPTFLALRSWPDLTPVWRVPLDCWDAATGNTDASGTLAPVALEDGRSVGVVDLRTRALRGGIITVPGNTDDQTGRYSLYSLSIRPDGRQVAGGLGNGTVMVWDVLTGKVRWKFRPHGGLVRALSWNDSGDALASSAFGGCGLLRSECVVVTRLSGASPKSRVVWHHRFNAVSDPIWLKRSALMLTETSAVFTVPTGLSDP